ncbi:MAG: hypothetical protein ABI267_01020 [Ginsengibacter sp.]
MRYSFIIFLFCATLQCEAQKFVLLDEAIYRPAVYTNHLIEMEKYKKFFPVEVKDIPQFLKVLEEIENRLSESKDKRPVKNYKVGCSEFVGRVFPLASGERIDYIITSTCEGIKIKMHLCDAKIGNADNLYFIKTWIKYIQSNRKQKIRK